MENTPEAVPAAEFTRNFGRYRMQAQREAVAVSSHGRITGYFVGPEEYEEFKRFRQSRRSFATAELSEEQVEAIIGSLLLALSVFQFVRSAVRVVRAARAAAD